MGRQRGQGRGVPGAGQQWAGCQAGQHHAPHAAELPGGFCAGASLPPFSAYSVKHNCLGLPQHQRRADGTLKWEDVQKCKNVSTEQKKGGTKVWHCCGEC